MPREAAALRKERSELLSVTATTTITIKGRDECDLAWEDYEITQKDDEIVVKAPCGEARAFKTAALRALLDLVEGS